MIWGARNLKRRVATFLSSGEIMESSKRGITGFSIPLKTDELQAKNLLSISMEI